MPDRQTMSNQFIRLTSGWIPASVMLLLATALVMGQDGPSTTQETAPIAAPPTQVDVTALLDPDDAVRLESIRMFVDSVLPVPETIEISIGATIRTDDESGQPDSVSIH